MAAPRLKVVILGGGFAGMQAAKSLAKAAADVTLIDRANHHTFQPLLYQVATAALNPSDIAWPIRWILARQANVRVLMAEVEGIDLDGRTCAPAAGRSATTCSWSRRGRCTPTSATRSGRRARPG